MLMSRGEEEKVLSVGPWAGGWCSGGGVTVANWRADDIQRAIREESISVGRGSRSSGAARGREEGSSQNAERDGE